MGQAVKKSNKAGRPKGRNNKWRTAKRIVDAMDTIEEKVSYDIIDAYKFIADTMNNKEASFSVRKGSAEIIVKLHEGFFKNKNKRSEIEISDEDGSEGEKEGVIKPFLTLTYSENEDEEESEEGKETKGNSEQI